jgi:hypothetical protein
MCTRDRRRGPAPSCIAVSTTVLTDGAYAVPRRVISGGGYGSRFEPVKPEYPTKQTMCRASTHGPATRRPATSTAVGAEPG